MIHIKLDNDQLTEIKKLWCTWFFRSDKMNEFVHVLENDIVFRRMIFLTGTEYRNWKTRFHTDIRAIKNEEWRAPICNFFFADLSAEETVISKYKKSLHCDTQTFLLKNYDNYRLSVTLAKIVNIMKIEVCPYCNRNFLEAYSIKTSNGSKKIYFKGDLDHHYPKDEIPALALSFYNLVPCCKVCNHEKQESTKRTFYPFYDYESTEYRFSIELYNENDYNDIIYDMPIENIDCKRFDSTVWQGISDNFNIKLIGIGKTKLSEHMENSKTVFRLEKKYNHSKEYVREIIRKKYIYPEIRKAELLSNFSNLFANESELLETIYSFSNSGESLHNRPLSKLTKDILYQLGILKEND